MSKIVTLFYNYVNGLNPNDAEIYSQTAKSIIEKLNKQKEFVRVKTFTGEDG